MNRLLLLLLSFTPIIVQSSFAQVSKFAPNRPATMVKKAVDMQIPFEEAQFFGFDARRNSAQQDPRLEKAVTKGTVVSLNKDYFESFKRSSNPAITLDVPTTEGVFRLRLAQVEVVDPDIKVRTSTEGEIKPYLGKHYRGVIDGHANSIVALSVTSSEIMGFFSSDQIDGNYVIGQLKDGRTSDHIIYNENDLKDNYSFICETPEPTTRYRPEQLLPPPPRRDAGDCIRVYVETDFDVYTNSGNSTQNVIDFVVGLMNQSITLFANESINMRTGSIFVWTSDDGYSGGAEAMRDAWQADNDNLSDIDNLELGHYIGWRSSGGGGIAAGFDALCNADVDARICVSQIALTFAVAPTYSRQSKVFTHEMGHLLGSFHTHGCYWGGGGNTSIDDYGNILPNTGGAVVTDAEGAACVVPDTTETPTIMGYYDSFGWGGFNLGNGFGVEPGNVIRNMVANSDCTAPCCIGANAVCDDITVTLNTLGFGTTTPDAVDDGSTTDCGFREWSLSKTAFNCNDVGLDETWLRVTDNNFITDSCKSNVTVLDVTDPVAQCKNIVVQLDDNGDASITGSDVDDNSTDACGIISRSVTPNTFDCDDVGDNMVVLTVEDPSGNSDNCNAMVTVEDNVNPVARCMDITITLDASGVAIIDSAVADAGSSDACGLAEINLSKKEFSCADYMDKITLFESDFNSDVGGWVPTNESGNPSGYTDADVATSGSAQDEFHSAPAKESDRTLSVYKSTSAEDVRWKLDLTNNTADTFDQLLVKYDFEIPWVDVDNTGPLRTAQLDWQLQIDGGASTTVHSSPIKDNTGVPAGKAGIWLIDSEMDAYGLREESISFEVSGIKIAPGQNYTIFFGNMGGVASEQEMNFGIDNVRICTRPADPPIIQTVTDNSGNTDQCQVNISLEGTDADMDGYVAACEDCDDSDPAVNPEALEVCGDGIDNNCDGMIDDVNQSGYCCATATNPFMYIDLVRLAYPFNESCVFNHSGPDDATNGYGNYTEPAGMINKDFVPLIYFDIKSGLNRLMYFRIWVDWDKDGTFDPYEVVAQNRASQTWTGQIVVPMTLRSIPGEYTMRIIGSQTGYQDDPCAEVLRGEVEDYTICIYPPPVAPLQEDLDKVREDVFLDYSPRNSFEMGVRPNPFSERFILETMHDVTGETTLQLFDNQGRVVMTRDLIVSKGLNQIEIETAHLVTGVYYLRVRSGNEVVVKRVVKK